MRPCDRCREPIAYYYIPKDFLMGIAYAESLLLIRCEKHRMEESNLETLGYEEMNPEEFLVWQVMVV
jgi:hypothetical protein